MTPIVCIVGPTCSGKSEAAVAAAKELQGEIVSADSMQVYRGFDIGTAKLSGEEMCGIPHHLIDCCDPTETFSAGDFQSRADRLIAEITARGRLPIIAGGTGLYIRALLLGLVPVGPGDARLRRRLRRRAGSKGIEAMHRLLKRLDRPTAERLQPGDTQRILRALEYRISSGRRLSDAIADSPFGRERYDAFKIGLKLPRDLLRKRIERRIEAMLEAGWVEEVRKLLDAGVPPDVQAFRAIGYREILGYLNKEVTLDEAIEEIKKSTIQYAKRQETWFRREPGVRWIDALPAEAARKKVIELIKTKEGWRSVHN